jgi:hypothetical protein
MIGMDIGATKTLIIDQWGSLEIEKWCVNQTER